MMPLPITEIDDFCEASFGGYSALFTEERIDRAFASRRYLCL